MFYPSLSYIQKHLYQILDLQFLKFPSIFCITTSNLRLFIQKTRIFDADMIIRSVFQIFS